MNIFQPTISGSLTVSGAVFIPTLVTSSVSHLVMYDTSSGQIYYTASSAVGGGGSGTGFPFSGSAIITGSLLVSQSGITVTGSISSTGGFTGSLQGTASFASTASFVSNAFIQGGNSFGTTALLGTNDTQNLAFETNGITRMLVSSSGVIGIETTTPSASLHISSSQENGMIIEANSLLTGSAALRITQTGTGSALIVEDATNPDATAFVIRYDGRVGIGYANSTSGLANLGYPLSVNGIIFCGDFVATTGQANTINPKDSVDLNLSTRPVATTNINLRTGQGSGGVVFTRMIVSGSGDVSILSGSLTVSGSVFATSSWATNALTASYVTGSVFTSANPALSASYALTASYAANAAFNSTSSNVGDGVNTSYTITHNFNTRNLHVTVYSASATYETVYPDIQRPTVNSVTILFANAPTTNQYVVYISQ